MNIVTAVVPISQSLVHHIREYRQYEQSSLTLDAYLASNPASKFHRYLDPITTKQHLRRLSAHIALSILPRSDRGSPVVFSFVREILATTALAAAVETYSDPDTINLAIVERCKAMLLKQANIEAGLAPDGGVRPEANGSSGDFPDGNLAGSTTSFTEISQPKMTRSRKSSENPFADQLYVKIVEGRRLPAGGASFYCAVICGNDLLKTKKVTAEANPIWMEDFQFLWDKEVSDQVENVIVDLYDSRTFR
ncbi:hypothetical protein HDU67_005787, partial [Dinochytrium kinnereticum]